MPHFFLLELLRNEMRAVKPYDHVTDDLVHLLEQKVLYRECNGLGERERAGGLVVSYAVDNLEAKLRNVSANMTTCGNAMLSAQCSPYLRS